MKGTFRFKSGSIVVAEVTESCCGKVDCETGTLVGLLADGNGWVWFGDGFGFAADSLESFDLEADEL